MNETEFQQLKEIAWQRKLTAQEESALNEYLTAHCDARGSWDEEMTLNHFLAKLPDMPVSSNFTSRVLREIEGAVARTQETKSLFPSSWKWLPRVAIASFFLCAGIFSVHEYREAKRTEVARDIAAVSSAATFPQEWLENFDAINRLSEPPVDDELLAALQ